MAPGKRTKIIIRQMEIDDLASVYRLGEDLFTSQEFPILYRTWDPYEVAQFFTSDPDYCLVAEKETDGKILGFILGTTIEKEGTAWKKYGYLAWIGVQEDHKKSRLGRRLYRELEKRLRKSGVRMIIADTDGENETALAFMEALGFSPRAEHVWLTKTLQGAEKRLPK
ncbi:MAG: GNAT family N-acetyltransferase [Chloroflexota bacterium]|nr:GNAT family N-acetyltransferase [Chloroflexota bacterium]